MTAKKRKASGANIPESQRGTVQVKLRLPQDVAEDLDTLAGRWKFTRSGTEAATRARPGTIPSARGSSREIA
jgi:hypothetical protein